MEAILDDHTSICHLPRIQPAGKEHRREFINKMPKLLLFRVRGAIGIATHFMLLTDWQSLSFRQVVKVRQNYEQVCY